MKPWTFMVYMAGDNNLDQAGFRDIKEMEEVGSTDTADVLVQYDRARQFYVSENRWEATRRYWIQKSDNPDSITSPEVGPELGEVNTGDPEVLADFARWVVENHPAENYALVLSSHGTGWTDWPEYRAARSFQRSLFNHVKRRATSKVSGLRAVEDPPLARAIANDDSARDFLDNQELSSVLTEIREALPEGQELAIVGFDACLMSTLEVLYQNRRGARFFIGSSATEPGEGWPYARVLRRFMGSTPPTPEELARGIVSDNLEHFRGMTRGDEPVAVTQAALDSVGAEPLARAVDHLAHTCREHLDEDLYIQLLLLLKRRIQRYQEQGYVDLLHLAQLLRENIEIPPLQEACHAVLEAARATVLCEGHLSEKVRNSHGISVYFPLGELGEAFESVYRHLDFCRDQPSWPRLLQAFHEF